MFVGRINKQNPDVSRFTVDLSEWLDDGEIATSILTHTITLGTTGWSNTPFPVPGSAPPYDPTPLLYTEVKLVDGGTAVEVYVSFGTPGNVYTCQFEVVGTTLREVTFEVGVQITGTPPAAPPVVIQPIPPDALSIYGGQMLGPLYLYRDPTYPTEASTKQYVDFAISLMQVSTKVNRSGDNMGGFLGLYADPVQPLQAATKHYVDMQIGSTLSDAPSDGFYYGRRNQTWAKVPEEAPLNTLGYLRSNGAWVRGVPQVGAVSVDVQVTDNNAANMPVLTGMQAPFSAATDMFSLVARRTNTGALDDGGMVQLFGPTYPTAPNGVMVTAGTRTVFKSWVFNQNGALTAPGLITALGTVRSSVGRLVSATTDGTQPSVTAWDQSHNVASGFWIGSTGALGFGQMDGYGAPVTAWATLTSTGIATATISTSANVAIGTSLTVGTSITAASLALTGSFSAANVSTTGDLVSNRVVTNSASVFGTITATGAISGTTFTGTGLITTQGDITAAGNISATNSLACAGGLILGPGGNGRIVQMTSNWYWDFNLTNGTMNWVSNGSMFWSMDANNNHICYNNLGLVAGQGNYVNLASSVRMKDNITDATQGLEQILALTPKTFRLTAQPDRTHLGFIIEEVRPVLPEAVTDIELDGTPTLGISDGPILAAAINAIKELHTRLQALEAH